MRLMGCLMPPHSDVFIHEVLIQHNHEEAIVNNQSASTMSRSLYR